jgi:hypothetical protein
VKANDKSAVALAEDWVVIEPAAWTPLEEFAAQPKAGSRAMDISNSKWNTLSDMG